MKEKPTYEELEKRVLELENLSGRSKGVNDIGKITDEKLKLGFDQLNCFFQSNILGVYIATAEGKVIEANDYYLNLIGYSRWELESGIVDWRKLTPAEWLESDEHAIGELRKKGSCEPYEKEFELRDGTRVAILITDMLLPGPEEQIAGLVLDITERRQTEEVMRSRLHLLKAEHKRTVGQLILNEEKFLDLFENMTQGAIYQLADGTIVNANSAALEMFGLTGDQLFGRTSYDPEWKVTDEHGVTLKPDQHPSMVALRTGKPCKNRLVAVYNPFNNHFRWLIVSAIPQFRPGLTVPFQAIVTMQDITERKSAEQNMKYSEELLSLFIKQSPIYAFIKEVSSTESRVIKASENYKDMIGIPGSEMVGKTMEELFPTEFAAKFTADDQAVVTAGKELRLEEDFIGRNYTTIKYPITLGNKKLLAGYTIDITGLKQAKAEISVKNEELVKLLAEKDKYFSIIAHDLRSPFTSLLGFTQMLVDDLPELTADELQKIALIMRNSAANIYRLLENLLEWSKIQRG